MTLTVPATGGTLNLNTAQDYILQAPNVITAPVTIQGGHNIVWVGGEFRYPSGNGATWAIKFTQNAGNGGTIHLEGLLIDGSNGNINDGIVGGQYASQSKPTGTLATTTLQIENVREIIRGTWSINHDDLIQQYGGWHELRIDCLTGTTEGQGFVLPYEDSGASNQGVLSKWDARNFNTADSSTGQTGEALLNFGDKSGSFNATTHQMTCNISNGWINPVLQTFDQDTYPNSGTSSSDGTVVHSVLGSSGLTTSWATTWNCPGSLNSGVPSGGDFVPAGVAGLGYVSPGY